MDKHADKNRPQMRNLKVLNIRPTVSTNISLCYLKHTRLSNGALEFIKTYKEKFGQQEL